MKTEMLGAPMGDDGPDSEVKLNSIEVRLRRLEERLEILERARAVVTAPADTPSYRPPIEEPQEQPAAPLPHPIDSNLLLAGRALIAVGGAYLLRAFAESKMIPMAAGVGLGFAYAAVWLWRSYRHAQGGRRAHAAFCAAIAAVIAYPIIWEATTRFVLFNSAAAAAAIAAATTTLVVIGYRNGGERIAWIGALGAIGCTVALAAGTRELVGPMLALAVSGAATWWCGVRRKWRYAPLPLAIEFNLIACALVGLSALDKGGDSRAVAAVALLAGFAIYAGAIVTRPLIRHEDIGPIDAAQVGIAAIPTLIGAPLVAMNSGPLAVVIAFVIGALGAFAYALMVHTRGMTVAPYFFGVLGAVGMVVGTANLLDISSAAALWGAAAGVTAILARRSMTQLWGHAALYALASSIAAGLFAAALGVVSGLGRHPLDLSPQNVVATLGIATAAGVAVASGAQPWRMARLVLAAIATLLILGALAAAIVPISHNDPAAAATLRSAIIAAAAVAIAFVARMPRVSELATLVTPLLILGALKFLVDDFGSGRAASLFITLATYGIALVVIARLRTSQPATT